MRTKHKHCDIYNGVPTPAILNEGLRQERRRRRRRPEVAIFVLPCVCSFWPFLLRVCSFWPFIHRRGCCRSWSWGLVGDAQLYPLVGVANHNDAVCPSLRQLALGRLGAISAEERRQLDHAAAFFVARRTFGVVFRRLARLDDR